MNKDQIAGRWKQLAAKIRYQWCRLTDDDLERAAKAAANTLQARFRSAASSPRNWPKRRSGVFIRGI
jgi:hypothetical protein